MIIRQMLTDLSLAYVFFGVLNLQLQVQSALLSGWQTMAVTLLQTLTTTHTQTSHLIRIMSDRFLSERACLCRPYSLVVDDVLVFSGHSGRPFPGLLVQTVLFRRPRLRFQLTTLINKHTRIPDRDE